MEPYVENPAKRRFYKFGTETLWSKGKKTKIQYVFDRIAKECALGIRHYRTGIANVFSMQGTAGAPQYRKEKKINGPIPKKNRC
jgi:hypothetical protein